MALIVWPTKVLPPSEVEFFLTNQTRSGGRNVLGDEQLVASSAERWTAHLTVPIRRYNQILVYRSMMAESGGRLGLWLVPTCSGFPYIVSSGYDITGDPIMKDMTGYATFGDTSRFSDSSRFQVGTSITAAVGVASFKGQSVITVVMSATNPAPNYIPLRGTYFSIGDNLYLIKTVSSDGASVVMTFAPRLRADAVIGNVINFNNASCKMRLAGDDTGKMPLQQLRFSDVSLDFVEEVN